MGEGTAGFGQRFACCDEMTTLEEASRGWLVGYPKMGLLSQFYANVAMAEMPSTGS